MNTTILRQISLVSILLLHPLALFSSVVSDRFALQAEMDGTDLLLAIDTDLPDTTELMVSVGRIYYEVGNDSAYSREYFAGRGRVLDWRRPRRILIDDEAWKADLKAHQARMAEMGSFMAFEIDRIEGEIQVSAVVHINQPDPRFGGRGNPNLSGRAVNQSGKRNLIRREENIERPLSGAPVAKRSESVAFDNLREGESYRLPKEVPMMSMHSSHFVNSDSIGEKVQVLRRTLRIPAGRVVRVIRVVSPETGGTTWPWYEVELIGNGAARGWINSVALMSHALERE